MVGGLFASTYDLNSREILYTHAILLSGDPLVRYEPLQSSGEVVPYHPGRPLTQLPTYSDVAALVFAPHPPYAAMGETRLQQVDNIVELRPLAPNAFCRLRNHLVSPKH